MLVLTRKPGEEVVIGDSTRVTVVAVQGNKVSLGFQAPREVVIYRHEVSRTPGGVVQRVPGPERGAAARDDVGRQGEEVVELSLLLPGGEAAALEAAASTRGLTVGELVRRLVRDWQQRSGKHVEPETLVQTIRHHAG